MTNCRLCGSSSDPIFKARILCRYDVAYYRCRACAAIFTEKPYWLGEAYASPIALSDTGILERNLHNSDRISRLLRRLYRTSPRVVDLGGGYGILVRLLRDTGVNAFWSDRYSENLFARGFEYDPADGKAEVALALEVAEHLDEPGAWFRDVLSSYGLLVLSTELIPENVKGPDDWWYFLPETGQHICFYTEKAMQFIAEMNSCAYMEYGGMHLFYRKIELRSLLQQKRRPVWLHVRGMLKRIERLLPDHEQGFESFTRKDHFAARDFLRRRSEKGWRD